MNSVKYNYIFQVLLQGINFLLPILIIPYIAKVLGPEVIGEVSYVRSIAYYFYVFGSLGLNIYASREVAYNNGNKTKNSIILSKIIFLKLIVFIPLVCIYLLVDLEILWLITLINVVYLLFDITWFFQGVQNFKILFYRNIVIKLISICLILLLINDQEDILLYALIMYSTLLIGVILLIPSLKNYIVFSVFRENFFDTKNFKLLLYSFPLYIPQLGIDLYNSLDRTFIGYFIGNSEVGFYEMSQKFVRIFLLLITSIGTVLMPKISGMIKEGKQIRTTLKYSFGFTLFLSFGFIGYIFVFSEYIIVLFLGVKFISSISILKILAFILLPIGLGSIIGTQYMLPMGMDKQLTIPVMVGLIINIILNSLLIKKFSANGAAIASVISEIFVVVTMILITFKRINFISLVMHYKNLLFITIFSVITIELLKSVADINYTSLLLLSLIYLLIYLISCYKISPFIKDQFLNIINQKNKD